jgi:hypothetical protein
MIPPVVLVIWNIRERNGYWQDIAAIIKQLDKFNSGWRGKTKVTVVVPKAHSVDVSGRAVLRHRIASLSLPMLAAGKQLSIKPTFTFPKTPKGRASLAALERAIEEGDEVTVGKKNISEFKMSPWYERAFGKAVPHEITIKPTPTEIHVSLLLTAVGVQRTESLLLDLRRTKAGTRVITLSNEHSASAAKMRLAWDKKAGTLRGNVHLQPLGKTIVESLGLTRILRVLAEGGTVRLAFPDGRPFGPKGFTMDVDTVPPAEFLERLERVLSMLAVVEVRALRFGRFVLPDVLKDEHIRDLGEVHAMCTQATWTTRMDFSATLRRRPVHAGLRGASEKSPKAEFTIDPFGDIELLGVRIPMGKVRVEFLDAEAVAKAFETAARAKSKKVEIPDANVRLHFLEWASGKDGPATTAEARRVKADSRGNGHRGRPVKVTIGAPKP